MRDFQYYSPTRVVFGKESELKAAGFIADRGAKKVLLVYGGGSAEKTGLLEKVRVSLREAGLDFTELGGAQPNPVLSFVRRGIALCLEQGVDFLLAVGGGSAIDAAKAIAIGTANPDIDIWDVFTGKADAKCALPLAVILTIAASGSETSNSAVITNEEGLVKRGLGSDLNRPVAAFMDPALLATLPRRQISAGITDIMMHTMDRYFLDASGGELTDSIAEVILHTAIRFGTRVFADPSDYEAVSELMWAGSISHNGLTGLGAVGNMPTHQLGHELSGLFDSTHGETLSAMWGSFARHVLPGNEARFARYAVKVWDIPSEGHTDAELAAAGIEETEKFFRLLGMPTSINDLLGRRLSDDELALMAEKCSHGRTRTVKCIKPLEYGDMLSIYKRANER